MALIRGSLIMDYSPRFYSSRFRLPLLVFVLLGLYVFARQSGILENANPYEIRAMVQQWGAYGVLLYVMLFCVGLLLYVPGTLFIIASGLVYGQWWGTLIAFIGANIGITVSFLVVRFVGGTPSEKELHPVINRLVSTLHSSPIKNIAIMRVFLWTAPALNYLLALTAVSPRHHLLGSLIGTIIPVAVMVYLTDWLLLRMY
ncbi:MAG: TVP38/TMEM64 family protein [Pseudomonadales bacterium]